MKGYFLKPGKYKDYIKVLKIDNNDVKSKKIFDVYDKNAEDFYKAGKFCYEGQKPVEVKKEEIKKEEPKKEEPKKEEVKKDVKKK